MSPNNGGRRIFPGKISPEDNPSPPTRRREVDLVATISPPIGGVPVYFNVWDVDDPFNENDPAMPDVGLIDNNTSGSDNRPDGESAWIDSDYTDENGEARVTFTVSIQPGNNYRAGASLLQDALTQAPTGQTMQDVADAFNANGGGSSGYSVPLTWSPMLTVWRTLHGETDSKARPAFAENTIDTFWNQPRFPSGTLTLDVYDQHDDDDFENGFIRIKADGFPDLVTRIITFRHSAFDDEIDTNITPDQWGTRPTSGNHPCTFSDDDLANEANFTAGIVGCDMGQGEPPDGFLPLPDTTGLVAHYQPAYILPVVDGSHTSTGAVPFIKNINSITDESGWDPALPFRTLAVGTSAFWTTYVYSAFQAEQSEDFDGEFEATKGISTHKESLFGDTKTYSDFGAQYTGMCAIFVEALRDGFPENTQRITISHEMAHTLGVDHTEGLMHRNQQTNEFWSGSLVELREYQGP